MSGTPWDEAFQTNIGGALAIRVAPQVIGPELMEAVEQDLAAGMTPDAIYESVWILTESPELGAYCYLYARAHLLGLVRLLTDEENEGAVEAAAGDDGAQAD